MKELKKKKKKKKNNILELTYYLCFLEYITSLGFPFCCTEN